MVLNSFYHEEVEQFICVNILEFLIPSLIHSEIPNLWTSHSMSGTALDSGDKRTQSLYLIIIEHPPVPRRRA